MENKCGDLTIRFQKFDRQYTISFRHSSLHRSFQFRIQNKNGEEMDINLQIN